ncbi:MAG: hypothetical protein EAZ32_17665 [Cytophagia bacterium]|nr:MAG: hypothetical protein EAZ38_18230 [Cytophagales bacterium]TAG35982.1 MAG: hypothetical protein EAZ32_17665 [Cytophagia bacterium]TAG69012.1 MAG: hypothetical protein EAZ26_07590 [Runella slithyformis]TAG77687.1 MAG: hypothetical protein EAZ22_15195 [Cytophagales bacterium]
MAHHHQFKTLIEKPYGYVGVCETCKIYNIGYKNFLLCLNEYEFEWFRNNLINGTMLTPFYTSHGKEFLHRTPMSNFYLTFSSDEVEELVAMLNEIVIVIEARKSLKNVN